MPKNADKYNCEICLFKCSKKSNWDIHILTAKHKLRILEQVKKDNNYNNKLLHICSVCNKEYKSRSALWYHKKNAERCQIKKEVNEDVKIENTTRITVTNEMFFKLMEQNNELQKHIIELTKEPKVVNNNNYQQNNNNNTTNNQFNLNMFLNEDCKNALNIDDFLNSLHLTVDDLVQTGELGFVQGITRIFLKGLKELEVTQRPIHCTDTKRETMYIKDQDKWNKETTDKKLMSQAVKKIEKKNFSMFHVWQVDHPDFLRSNTKDNVEYYKMYENSLGSVGDEEKRMYEKIIRNVLKEVVIDRKSMNQIEEEEV